VDGAVIGDREDRGEAQWTLLGFEEAALSAFAFLSREFAFKLVGQSPTNLVYTRAPVQVAVSLDRNSFELRCNLLVGEPQETYTVWELARLNRDPLVHERTFLQASSASAVARLIPQLAELLRRHGHEALAGHPGVFDRLRAQQVRESDAFLLAGKLSRMREQVSEPWQRGEFARVVRLMEPLEASLTPSEQERLRVARQRMQPE
jgi:hypothetical protein